MAIFVANLGIIIDYRATLCYNVFSEQNHTSGGKYHGYKQ